VGQHSPSRVLGRDVLSAAAHFRFPTQVSLVSLTDLPCELLLSGKISPERPRTKPDVTGSLHRFAGSKGPAVAYTRS
jgi:hypothetical protein